MNAFIFTLIGSGVEFQTESLLEEFKGVVLKMK